MPLEYRSDVLQRSLQSLHRHAPRVLGSAIITVDGLLIASHPPGWDSNIHDPAGGESVAAMAAVVASTAERTMKRLEQGRLERVLMEGEDGAIAVLPITDDAGLALLIHKDAPLGLTLLAARRTADEIAGVLSKDRA